MLFTSTAPLDPSLLGWLTILAVFAGLALAAVLLFRQPATQKRVLRNISLVALLLVGMVFTVGQNIQVQERVTAEARQQLTVLADVVYDIQLTSAQADQLLDDYNSWDLANIPTAGVVEKRPAVELGLPDGPASIQLVWTGDEWVLADGDATETTELPQQ